VQPYDAELGVAVARAQEGDEVAFAAAYRIVQPGLLGYLRGIVGDDAEDVASDAWLEIARDLRRFKGDGAGFRGWTATIARHRALDHLRRQKVRPRSAALEQDVLELPGPYSTHDQALPPPCVLAVALITRRRALIERLVRWARQRGLSRTKGHEQGEHSLFDTIEGAIELGVPFLSA